MRERGTAIDVGRRETQAQELRRPFGRDERSSGPVGKTAVPFRLDEIQRNQSVLKKQARFTEEHRRLRANLKYSRKSTDILLESLRVLKYEQIRSVLEITTQMSV